MESPHVDPNDYLRGIARELELKLNHEDHRRFDLSDVAYARVEKRLKAEWILEAPGRPTWQMFVRGTTRAVDQGGSVRATFEPVKGRIEADQRIWHFEGGSKARGPDARTTPAARR